MELVRDLPQLSRADLELAGGKGANLGELARAGLPVPPGFVLLTTAYRAFIAQNGLQAEIEALAAVPPDDAAALAAAEQAIRARFAAARLPEEIAAALRAAYAALGRAAGVAGDCPVAVRSSATAEDLPGASFAGQQESYLNVSGESALLAAVQRCWSSLWTARAISYRARQGIPPGAVALAVVVQQLVDAEAAGILFTANPVSGRRDQMVIDAAWGLGEAVVSGQVTPDQYVIARGGILLEARIAHKAVQTGRTPDGVALRPVPAAQQAQPVLREPEIAALADLGRRAAAHFGAPQDVEWAMAGGCFCVVQSRPITSLFPLPEPRPVPELGQRVYICMQTLQGLVEPFTPLGISAFRTAAAGGARCFGLPVPPGAYPQAFKTAAGRIYLDVTDALRYRPIRRLILAVTGIIDRPLQGALRALVERERLEATRGGLPLHPPLGLLLTVLGRTLFVLAFPDAGRRRRLRRAEAQVRAWEQAAAGLQGVAARVRFATDRLGGLFPFIISNVGPVAGPGIASRFASEALLRRWLGAASPGLADALRSLPHNPTTEMDLALWRGSRQLLAEGVAPSADHPAVQAFLATYGHRAVREIDVGVPRWREAPAPVLAALRTYLDHDPAADPARQFAAGEAAAQTAVADLIARVRRERGALHAALLRWLLRRVRALTGTREYPKFYAVRLFALVRAVLLGAGAELVAAGRLAQAEDVAFLAIPELADASLDLRALVAARRAEFARERQRRAVPRVVTSLGESLYGAPAAEPGALVGTPASPGVYEGPVRVVHDPYSARLLPGEVLVAPGTDPAWTPLFLSAGALVMEIGGIMSHGSVVAREYGIPAVVGVTGATEQLRTGQRVRVDGETGRVIPLD